jgi:hypothetical protein
MMAAMRGMFKGSSMNTLAKACLFVRIDEWKQIDFQLEGRRIEGAWYSR